MAAAAAEPPEEQFDVEGACSSAFYLSNEEVTKQAQYGRLTSWPTETEEAWKRQESAYFTLDVRRKVIPQLIDVYKPFAFHDGVGPQRIDFLFTDNIPYPEPTRGCTEIYRIPEGIATINYRQTHPWIFTELCNITAHEMTHIAVQHYVFQTRGVEEANKLAYCKGEYGTSKWVHHGLWFRKFGNNLGRVFPGLAFGKCWVAETLQKLRKTADVLELEGFQRPPPKLPLLDRQLMKEQKPHSAPVARAPVAHLSVADKLRKMHEGDKRVLIEHVYGTKYVANAYKRLLLIFEKAMELYARLEKDASFDQITVQNEVEMWYNYVIYTDARDDIVVFAAREEQGMKQLHQLIFATGIDERILRFLSDTETNKRPLFGRDHPRHHYGSKERLSPTDLLKNMETHLQ